MHRLVDDAAILEKFKKKYIYIYTSDKNGEKKRVIPWRDEC